MNAIASGSSAIAKDRLGAVTLGPPPPQGSDPRFGFMHEGRPRTEGDLTRAVIFGAHESLLPWMSMPVLGGLLLQALDAIPRVFRPVLFPFSGRVTFAMGMFYILAPLTVSSLIYLNSVFQIQTYPLSHWSGYAFIVFQALLCSIAGCLSIGLARVFVCGLNSYRAVAPHRWFRKFRWRLGVDQ